MCVMVYDLKEGFFDLPILMAAGSFVADLMGWKGDDSTVGVCQQRTYTPLRVACALRGFLMHRLWVHGDFPAGRTIPCGAWYISAPVALLEFI